MAGSSFVPAKNCSLTATSGGFSTSLHEWRDLVEPAGAMTGAPGAEPDEVLLETPEASQGVFHTILTTLGIASSRMGSLVAVSYRLIASGMSAIAVEEKTYELQVATMGQRDGSKCQNVYEPLQSTPSTVLTSTRERTGDDQGGNQQCPIEPQTPSEFL